MTLCRYFPVASRQLGTRSLRPLRRHTSRDCTPTSDALSTLGASLTSVLSLVMHTLIYSRLIVQGSCAEISSEHIILHSHPPAALWGQREHDRSQLVSGIYMYHTRIVVRSQQGFESSAAEASRSRSPVVVETSTM